MTGRVHAYCQLATGSPGDWGHVHDLCTLDDCTCPCHPPRPALPPGQWVSLGTLLDSRDE